MIRTRLAVSLVALALAALAIALPTALARQAAPKATTVNVSMGEFFFKLSKTSAPRGVVIFKVKNVGQIAHDFDFNTGIRKSMPVIGPGKTFTYKVNFTKKGRYGYVCTLPRHAQDGMSGQFVIR